MVATFNLPQMLKLMVHHGHAIDGKGSDGQTALIRAASLGHVHNVDTLLQLGAAVDDTDTAGETALRAAMSAQADVVALLLQHGADVNHRAAADWTVLMSAVASGNTPLAKILLDAGAQLDAHTTWGDSMASLALSDDGGPSEDEPLDLSDALDDVAYTRGFARVYDTLEELSQDSCVSVFVCRSKVTGVKYAVKVLTAASSKSTNKILIACIKSELQSMAALCHENIVRLFHVFVEEQMDKIHLVMELGPHGELFDYIKQRKFLSEHDTRTIYTQLFAALEFMHDTGWMHRDVRPENIVICNTEKLFIKLADFGLAARTQDTKTKAYVKRTTFYGSDVYAAPEVLSEPDKRSYGCGVDVWSAGVLLYICLCGFPPFSDELYSESFPFSMSDQILHGRFDYPCPYWDAIGDSALDLIDSMLVVEAEKRYTVKQCLQHPWLTGTPDIASFCGQP
ncbi:hypothetical protein CDD82_6131 [Ophiocordyceps australis]|uniref:Protein kinase domain-containing protein n=1 Tax=Ophiocordyceps australis TaxID=1399860 RepID=A0A2C5YYS2_9HYPO|nr:hypothetical protein CDD82_6131 [Ophiocordyceps australis]